MNNPSYVIGLDLGTTRVKGILINKDGRIMASDDANYPLHRPTNDAAEQNPEDWWKSSCKVINTTIERSGVAAKDIVGLGIAGQMHTGVFLNGKFEPIRPAITWADNRTGPEAQEIEDQLGTERLLDITYNRSLPGFTASKVLWLKNHEPKNFDQLFKLVLPKDYLRYRLTDELLAEKAGASATLLFNLAEEDWSDDLLQVVGLTRKHVPPLVEPLALAGEITKNAANKTGLAPGTPVVAGAGDQQAGALGIGAVKPGIVVSTIGTGGQIFTTVPRLIKPHEGRIHVFRGCLQDSWHFMGAMQTAGLALRWFKESILDQYTNNELDYDEISRLADNVPAGSNNLLFLPYLAGERSPHMDPHARGCLIGLTLNHELPHILRSIMEGVTFGMKDSLQLFQNLNLPVQEIRCSGGGANSPVWKQIQADIYGQKVVKTNIQENSAFGAAIMAAVGSGLLPSISEQTMDRLIKVTEETLPKPGNIESYKRLHKRFQKLYRVLKPEFEALSEN